MYDDGIPTENVRRDGRADLIDRFFAAEQDMAQLQERRDHLNREREQLAEGIEKGHAVLADLRKQIGDAFGLTDHTTQASMKASIKQMVGEYR